MQKLQTFINWAVISSEVSHIFCCALPTLFSLLALLTGLGVITAIPSEVEFLHHMIHDYEVPVIIASGLVLVVGWALYYISYRIDCRSTGCVHEPCTPKKKRSAKILLIATLLFVFNVSIYTLFHAPHDDHHDVEESHSVLIQIEHAHHG